MTPCTDVPRLRRAIPAVVAVLAVTSGGLPARADDADAGAPGGAASEVPLSARLVRAGGHGDLPPYEFLDAEGQPSGFNIDLLREVADAAGFRVDIRLGPWDRVVEDVAAGNLDLIVGIHATPERRQRYDFPTPYTDLPYDVFVRDDPASIRSLEDLRGREVLVQARALGQRLAGDAGALPVPVESPREVVRELSRGRCELALLGRYPALWMAAEMKLENVIPVGLDLEPRQYGFAVRRGQQDLVAALDRGLTKVKATGRYQALWEQWFGLLERPRTDVWKYLRYSALVVGPLAFLMLLWGLWTASLRREVRQRTGELEVELSARRATEAALSAEREQLAVTLRSIADAVVTVDPSGRILLANRAARNLFGMPLEQVRGRPLEEVLPLRDELTGEACDALRRCLEGQAVAEMRRAGRFTAPDGTERLVSGSVAALRDPESRLKGAVLVLRDVGEQRRVEAELARSDKLQSLGVLAGGIAHDFNNILAAISGNLSLARMRTGDPEAADFLARAGNAADRAQDLTVQLLTFARGGTPRKRLVALDGLVADAARFILSGSSSRAEVEAAPGLWPVEVDEGQFVQVVHNLTLNAAQSMAGGGVVRLALENVRVEAGDPSGLEAGPCVRLSVSDTGSGIQRDLLSRIFEPFFTTKARGTGLGLSICYSIVTRHGGWIGVESAQGRGTTFRVLLPALPSGRPAVVATPMPRRGFLDGRVLVMDDNDLVRSTVESQLEFLGLTSVGARDGSEAVDLYRAALAEGRPFSAVILDLTVPGGMGGVETLEQLRQADPDVVALVFSGYSEAPPGTTYEEAGFAGALGKPYTMQHLAQALERALQRRQAGA